MRMALLTVKAQPPVVPLVSPQTQLALLWLVRSSTSEAWAKLPQKTRASGAERRTRRGMNDLIG